MNIQRATAVYVLNDQNQVLMLFHKKLKKWLPPGGHVESNELIYKAAIREVKEETGLKIDFFNEGNLQGQLDERAKVLPKPFLVQLENLGDHYHEDHVFIARARDNKIKNNEFHEIGWYDFFDAKQLDLFENTRVHLEELQKKYI